MVNGLASPQYNVLVLYENASLHVVTTREHVESFQKFSQHRVFYAAASWHAHASFSFDYFDAVVIHYSVRLCFDWISPSLATRLSNFRGTKILFIQDEYEHTEKARRWMEKLGVDVVYTCVPPAGRERVYPASRFPNVEFVSTLTGYAPTPATMSLDAKPISQRRWTIGYRGRPLSWRFGHLGREKVEIGRRMRDICRQRGVPVNIEWEEEHRIYGDAWPEFLSKCKATLATESGSNVFDDDGRVTKRVAAYQREHPAADYDEVHRECIGTADGQVMMNQISPKVFEAIAAGTALVMFEGEYSGVVRPNEHFIPLQKDFSNVDEVLAKLEDDEFLRQLTRRAFDDVIASRKHSYRQFVAEFDEMLGRKVGRGIGAVPVLTLSGFHVPGTKTNQLNDECIGPPPTVAPTEWDEPIVSIAHPVNAKLFLRLCTATLQRGYRWVRHRLSADYRRAWMKRIRGWFGSDSVNSRAWRPNDAEPPARGESGLRQL